MGDSDDSTLDADWAGWDVELYLGRTRDRDVPGHRGDRRGRPRVGPAGHRDRLGPGAVPGTEPAITLRTREDASALRAMLRPGTRLVIVGAGWIGAEVATRAVRAGAHVTVVEALHAPLANALPDACGARMLPWWRRSTCCW
jgi:NADPH-dependent 2,4-dienoyl-CoA reductase/sulfur reductase-like enzyme